MTEAKQENAMAEAKAEQRHRMKRMRNAFETRYKFVQQCERGSVFRPCCDPEPGSGNFL